MGLWVRTSRSRMSWMPASRPKDFKFGRAARSTSVDQMVWLKAGRSTAAIPSPIPLPVSRRRVLLGIYRFGTFVRKLGLISLMRYRYELAPSMPNPMTKMISGTSTLQGGIFLPLGPAMDWKIKPVIAPRYMPVQRAHRGSWIFPMWKERVLIWWQTAYPIASALPSNPDGVLIHHPIVTSRAAPITKYLEAARMR